MIQLLYFLWLFGYKPIHPEKMAQFDIHLEKPKQCFIQYTITTITQVLLVC